MNTRSHSAPFGSATTIRRPFSFKPGGRPEHQAIAESARCLRDQRSVFEHSTTASARGARETVLIQ
jgi:hypothetical protein